MFYLSSTRRFVRLSALEFRLRKLRMRSNRMETASPCIVLYTTIRVKSRQMVCATLRSAKHVISSRFARKQILIIGRLRSLRQFLIDINQIYRHSSVPKTRLLNFSSFLAQAVSEHGAAATFFVMLCLSRCSESIDCLALA